MCTGTCNTISNFYLWPLNDPSIVYVKAVDQSTNKEITKIMYMFLTIFFILSFILIFHSLSSLPSARIVLFLFNAAANSTAPSWLIWLFLRSKTCKASFAPTPSQNMAKELSSMPKAFHSKQKLKNRIYIMLLYYWIDELSYLYMYMIPLWQTLVVFFSKIVYRWSCCKFWE